MFFRVLLLITNIFICCGSYANIAGYENTYFMYGQPRTYGLISNPDFPQYSFFSEVNLNSKENLFNKNNLTWDASLIGMLSCCGDNINYNNNGDIQSKNERSIQNSFDKNYQLYINEFYADFHFKKLDLYLGKMKLNLGTGYNYSPSNIINQQNNILDYQTPIEGVLLSKLVYNIGNDSSFSLGVSPGAQFGSHHLYKSVFYFDDSSLNENNSEYHYAVFMQYYITLFNTDLFFNIIRENLYNNKFENKNRYSINLSRYINDVYEVHFDGIFQEGSDRIYANNECSSSLINFNQCLSIAKNTMEFSKINDKEIFFNALVGTRYQFQNDSFLNLEYLYQKDGYNENDFKNFVKFSYYLLKLSRAGIPISLLTSNPSSFSLMRKNYLFFSYQNIKISESIKTNIFFMQNIDDTSFAFMPSITWSLLDNLELKSYYYKSLYWDKSKIASIPGTNEYFSEQDYYQYSSYLQIGLKYIF